MRIFVASLLCLGCSAGTLSAMDAAHDYYGRAIGGAWFASLQGDFDYDKGGVSGTGLDVGDFGDLDNLSFSPMLEAGVHLPVMIDLHAGMYSFSADGSTTLTSSAVFGCPSFSGAASSAASATVWRS